MLRPALFGTRKPMFFDNEFDRFFDNAFGDAFPSSFFENNPLNSMKGFSTDVIDQGDHYLLQAELPGFKKEEIAVNLSNDTLTISASHNEETDNKDKEKQYIRKERHYSSYQRSFYVEGIAPSDIQAEYKDGILEVTFPKKEITQKEEPKKIEVK